MSSKSNPVFLGDLIEINPRVNLSRGRGYPFVDMAAVQEWQRDIPARSLCRKEFKGSGAKFEAGDILVARITPCFENGKTAVAPAIAEPAHGSTEFIVVRPKRPEDRAYIYGLLRSSEFREYAIKQMVGTSGRQRIPNDALRAWPLALPQEEYRAKASEILAPIEDLCSQLRRQNTVLESIAKTLYRSWFVNFDPVVKKASGGSPEAMQAEVAALFPSDFEESQAVPKGWRVGKLSDIASLNPESWSVKRHPAVIRYIDLAGLKENVVLAAELIPFANAPSRARRVLRKGDALYGTVRPGNLSYGFVSHNEEGLTGSTGFAVLRAMQVNAAEFVYCAMSSAENIDRLTHLAEGAAYPAVRPDIVHEQTVNLPTPEVMEAFHQVVSPLFEGIAVNNSLLGTLAALRDHLIPRLVLGKLALADTQALLSEIAAI